MSRPGGKELILVVGVGRSGTSLLTGVLGQLGVHVPQPEVRADETNPRGFGEPRWIVDFHTRLLRKRRVTVNDARPAAWASTTAAAEEPAAHAELLEWLARQTGAAEAIVVKDPRTVWFLPLWMRCAAELAIAPSFVTMLRHPAETVASARKSYGTWQSEASRAAAWVNVALETERLTRDARRAFVRYEDLLADWAREVARVGTQLELPLLRDVDRSAFPQIDGFVDPSLHRSRATWADANVPAALRDLAEESWRRLQPLAGADGGDTPAVRAALDETRASFQVLYAEAEQIAQSSITAAKPRGGAGPGRAAAARPTSLRVRVAHRLPVRYRRMLRRAVHSLRRTS
jgi:hypothetical protein